MGIKALQSTKIHLQQTILLFVQSAIYLLFMQQAAFASDAPSIRHPNTVLILTSYSSIPWTRQVVSGIRQKFDNTEYDLKIEYLDAKIYSSGKYREMLTEILRYKYSNIKFPVVITIDNAALNFFVKHNQDIFHNSPLVFCGINNFSPQLLGEKRNYTGVPEINGYSKTLQAALKIKPKAKSIYIITDGTPTSILNLEEIKQEAETIAPSIPLKTLQSLGGPQLQSRFSSISPDDIILLISFWRQKNGQPIDGKTIRETFAKSPSPIFSDHDWMLDYNVTGGYCVNGVAQGNQAAHLALNILKGANTEDIPITSEPRNQYIFNYHLLNKYHIPKNALPLGAKIHNAPQPFYKVHNPLFVVLIAAIIIFAIFAVSRIRLLQKSSKLSDELLNSRNLYQTLAENINLGICLIDQNLTIKMCNNTFMKIFDRSDPAEKKIYSIYNNEDHCSEEYAKYSKLAPGEGKYTEKKYTNKHGELIPVSIRTFPLFECNKLTGYIDVVENMLSDYTIASKLRSSEEKFSTIFNSVRETIFIHEIESGKIVDVNLSASDMFGYTREEMLNSPVGFISSCLDTYTNEEAIKVIHKAAEGQPLSFEWQGRHKNGTLFWIEVSLQKTKLSGTNYVIAIIRNIDQRKKNEEHLMLQRQMVQSAKRSEAISKLASGVAHDINNLLGGILGGIEIIQTQLTQGNTNFGDIFNMITRTTQRATDLTDKLLSLSKRELLDMVKTDIHQTIQRALSHESQNNHKRFETELNLNADKALIPAEPRQLDNLFENLLRNAIESINTGGKISISSCNAVLTKEECAESPAKLVPGEYVIIDIQDNGCGIHHSDIDKIFEPFFTTKGEAPSRGLGLASAKGITLSHNGDITVKSSPSHGSTFTVFLPLNCSNTPSTKIDHSPNSATSNVLKGQQKTILIIDDEPVIRGILKSQISKMGFSTLEAENGEEGFKTFMKNRRQICLIILDMVMPQMNGERCLKEIRQKAPEARVLAISGHYPNEPEKLRKSINGFVKKPFTCEELSAAIQDAL